MDADTRLVRIGRDVECDLRELARECVADGLTRWQPVLDDPDAFYAEIERNHAGEDLAPDRVPQTEFWLMRGTRILGGSRLRHRLNAVLERDGGNIGYEIRPSERRRGYGTRLLRLMLAEARAIGLTRALLTTDVDNVASMGVIRRNGGVFDGTSVSTTTGRTMNRFWIEL